MPQSILIVDDEPDIAEVLGDRLEASGYDIRVRDSARGCYDAVEEAVPDLVLMDIQMPGESGLEALEKLKVSHPDLPVVICSASPSQDIQDDALSRGARAFLLKPYEPAALMQAVTSILGTQ